MYVGYFFGENNDPYSDRHVGCVHTIESPQLRQDQKHEMRNTTIVSGPSEENFSLPLEDPDGSIEVIPPALKI